MSGSVAHRLVALLATVQPDSDLLDGPALRRLRLAVRVSVELLAAVGGTSPASVRDYEKGSVSAPRALRSASFLRAQAALRRLSEEAGVTA